MFLYESLEDLAPSIPKSADNALSVVHIGATWLSSKYISIRINLNETNCIFLFRKFENVSEIFVR